MATKRRKRNFSVHFFTKMNFFPTHHFLLKGYKTIDSNQLMLFSKKNIIIPTFYFFVALHLFSLQAYSSPSCEETFKKVQKKWVPLKHKSIKHKSAYYAPRNIRIQGRKDAWDKVNLRVDELEPLLIDDLLLEMDSLDFLHIVILKDTMGVEFFQDLVEKRVSGVELMYDVGLTRDQIRDLYFILKNKYGLTLHLGEGFAYKLNIFK